MGAHSSLMIRKSDAERIYREQISETSVCVQDIEHAFDRALDADLYNCVIVGDDSPEPTNAPRIEVAVREYYGKPRSNPPAQRRNLAAFTAFSYDFPAYVSINQEISGKITLTAREQGHSGEKTATLEIPLLDLERFTRELLQNIERIKAGD